MEQAKKYPRQDCPIRKRAEQKARHAFGRLAAMAHDLAPRLESI